MSFLSTSYVRPSLGVSHQPGISCHKRKVKFLTTVFVCRAGSNIQLRDEEGGVGQCWVPSKEANQISPRKHYFILLHRKVWNQLGIFSTPDVYIVACQACPALVKIAPVLIPFSF